MAKFLLTLLLDRILEAVRTAVSDWLALQKKKKEDEQAVKDAIKIKDPAARARAVANLLR